MGLQRIIIVPLVPAEAGTQLLGGRPSCIFWIPAPCFAKAKPIWLRGGEYAGMSGARRDANAASSSSSLKNLKVEAFLSVEGPYVR
jgi:hypothetical protein